MSDQLPKITTCLVGNGGVGKTWLLRRFIFGDRPNTDKPTVGVDFETKQVTVDDNMINLRIYDTAGQDCFRTIVSSYLRHANVIILSFSIENLQSFTDLDEWLKTINETASPNTLVIISANKCDLENDRVITSEQAQQYASSKNLPLIETSSQTGQNVDMLFETAAKIGFQNLEKFQVEKNDQTVQLNKSNDEKKEKCC